MQRGERTNIEMNRECDAHIDHFLRESGWISLRFWERDMAARAYSRWKPVIGR